MRIPQRVYGYLSVVLVLMALSAGPLPKLISAQFKVYGDCGNCRRRIEAAAIEGGAKSADWNVLSNLMTVKFNPETTSLKKIETAIANAGHDTEDIRATDSAYLSLTKYCRYPRGPEIRKAKVW